MTVLCDGMERTLPAGGHLKLDPGESVTLFPTTWHAFWGEGSDVLIGEVSTVNDDLTETEAKLKSIITAERLRLSQQPKLVDHVRALQSEFEDTK